MDSIHLTIAPGVFFDPTIRKDLEVGEEYVMLDATGLKRIGLTPAQMKLLLRLEHAGWVVMHQITPRRRLLRLSSWEDHLARVQNDPDFWDNNENRRRWRLACLSI